MKAPTRPLVRYHGGKWRLAPWIIQYLPTHRTYVEPFGGGGSVLIRKRRSYAEVYNELDGEMVNLFRVVRDDSRRLMRACAWTAFARDEYYLAFEPTDDPLEQARRTLVRAYMGFGSNSINRRIQSGFRANSNRKNTTPAHDWANFPPQIRRIGRRLRGVVFENRPAAEVIARHDSAFTCFYVDPPYVHDTRSSSRDHGYAHEMTDDQHRELAAQLRQVRGMVVVSGYPCPLYAELYADWEVRSTPALADGAMPRTEMLWLNPSASEALAAQSLFGAEGSRP